MLTWYHKLNLFDIHKSSLSDKKRSVRGCTTYVLVNDALLKGLQTKLYKLNDSWNKSTSALEPILLNIESEMTLECPPEHKPGTNGNVGCAVKQLAKTNGQDIHPDYGSILKTDVRNQDNKLFLTKTQAFPGVITFIPGKQLLMKEYLSQGLMH